MHRKGRQDAMRSKMFSKLAREITVAAKQGLPDPDMNPRLRLAIQARDADRGILICGSGVAASVAVTHMSGVRSAVCHDT